LRELAPLLERIVVEGSRLGLSEGDLRKALLATWGRLKGE
jgi:hypothetical protein